VTFKISKCESAQNIIMDSIKRLKHRIACCSIRYDFAKSNTLAENVYEK